MFKGELRSWVNESEEHFENKRSGIIKEIALEIVNYAEHIKNKDNTPEALKNKLIQKIRELEKEKAFVTTKKTFEDIGVIVNSDFSGRGGMTDVAMIAHRLLSEVEQEFVKNEEKPEEGYVEWSIDKKNLELKEKEIK